MRLSMLLSVSELLEVVCVMLVDPPQGRGCEHTIGFNELHGTVDFFQPKLQRLPHMVPYVVKRTMQVSEWYVYGVFR